MSLRTPVPWDSSRGCAEVGGGSVVGKSGNKVTQRLTDLFSAMCFRGGKMQIFMEYFQEGDVGGSSQTFGPVMLS